MPLLLGDGAVFIQNHFAIIYFTETTHPVFYTGGYNIQIIGGVIVALEAVGFADCMHDDEPPL